MKLPSKIKFADEKIRKAFEELEHGTCEEKRLFDSLNLAFSRLEENAFCGIQIPKRLIPQEYLRKYGIDNCWKCNLPNAWRLIYSVAGDEVIVVSIVLEWMNHKEYERKFRY